MCDPCWTGDLSRVFLLLTLWLLGKNLATHESILRKFNCVNGRWWIVPKLSGIKKSTFLLFFLALSPLKSHKSSLILIDYAKIFRLSNSFTGKLIHAATEFELSCLNILIRQLKSLKPVCAKRERESAKQWYASHQEANDELHFVLFILVFAGLQGSVWLTQMGAARAPARPASGTRPVQRCHPLKPRRHCSVKELPGSRLT